MANRFPLIVDSSALQIKELPSGDNLDLTGNNITGVVDITASGDISIGGTLTYQDVTNVDSVGLITAREGISIGAGKSVGSNSGTVIYYGDGSNLSGLPQSGIGIQTAGAVGYGVTLLKFVGAAVSDFTTPHSGISTLTLIGGGGGGGGGLTTEAATPSNAVVTLDLTGAQDHKITATGIVTVTTSGGTEGESHTVRIVNSGIATVGFSTYFLFPSGSTPVLPTGTGDISLISFTVNRVGSAGTQLLAGASLNFS
tara:strand:- start:78 stop:842 length:765 start_codon:yes stop_codon:yes gene_type:complete